jgi:hypothetical protein
MKQLGDVHSNQSVSASGFSQRIFDVSQMSQSQTPAIHKISHRKLIIAAAALFCAAPLSLHWSPTKTPSLSVDNATAVSAEPDGTARLG